ncbi:ABC transporter substrate-binding protein [Faecalimonas sp.]
MKMKKIISLALVGVVACSVVACGGKKSESDTLIVGTEAGFAPYEYMKGNKIVGIDMDIAKAIADEMGKELKIKNMEFDGALASVASGKVDFVAAGVSINEERKKTMDFSHEYVDSTEVIVVNSKTQAITGNVKGESLNGKVVAVQQGNIADSWVSNKDNCNPKEIKRYTKFAQASEDLKNNKVDCIVMDKYPAEKLVSENKELKILDGVLFEDKYAVAVKKGNKELLEQINKVIDKLIADGKIEEFTANHTQK